MPSRLSQKTPVSSKPGRYNIDNTDTESEADDQATHPTSFWVNEWKLYLNTYEVVPDDLSLVQWWGVSVRVRHGVITELPTL